MFDYDADGRMDLFFTNGAQILDPMRKGKLAEKASAKFWNRLYRQKADGAFEDATEKAGVKGEARASRCSCTTPTCDGTDFLQTARQY